MTIPRVAICVDRNGNWSVKTDGKVDIYCVDDNCPDDRVYEMDASLYTISSKEFSKLLGDQQETPKEEDGTRDAGCGVTNYLMNCELDAETRHVLSSLAYENWSKAFNFLRLLKEKKDDGTWDWQAFHEEELHRATLTEEKARMVKDAICKYSPLNLGK